MRIGFAVSIPEQVDRFAPVAARIPGARWIIPPGRWPSTWLDSNQWTREVLRLRERVEVAEPPASLDLVVAGGGIAARALRPWLHRSGGLLRIADEWAGGPDWPDQISRDDFGGDPRLEAALQPATRARIRASLGLSTGSDRRCVVVRFEHEAGEAAHFAQSLSRLRRDADVIVAPSNVCWLHAPTPVPAPLHGPGIAILRDRFRWAELLAVADVVVAEAGAFAADALRLGKPVVLLGAGRVRRRAPHEDHEDFERVVSILDGSDLEDALQLAIAENSTIHATLDLRPEREGASTRCARLLTDRAVAGSFERVLADLSTSAN